MLDDIVVDANVFAHAANQQEQRREASVEFLKSLRKCKTHLCVDSGFSLIESSNRSQIGSEYLRHLKPGSVGYALIAHLAKFGRVQVVSRSVSKDISKKIRQCLRSKPDCVYVKVAFNSSSKTLASHDFRDITPKGRNNLRSEIAVDVRSADEALLLLA